MNNTGLATFGRPVDETYFHIALVSSNPTIPTTSNATLSGYESVRVGSDGITPAVDLGKGDPVKDWAHKDVLASPADPSATLAVPIIDNSVAAKKIKYGAANVTATGQATFDGSTDAWVIVVDELHNDSAGEPTQIVRTVYPNCVPQEIELGTHTRGDLIIDTVTFQLIYDTTIGGYFRELPPVTAE